MQEDDRVTALTGELLLARLVGGVAAEALAAVGAHQQDVHHPAGLVGDEAGHLHPLDLVDAPLEVDVGRPDDQVPEQDDEGRGDEQAPAPAKVVCRARKPVVAGLDRQGHGRGG